MTLNILFLAPAGHWADYEAPLTAALTRALDGTGEVADLRTQASISRSGVSLTSSQPLGRGRIDRDE